MQIAILNEFQILPVFIADVLYNVGQYIKRELLIGNNACMVSYDNTAPINSVSLTKLTN